MGRWTRNERLSIILNELQSSVSPSTDELAEALSVTKRTIRNDVMLLNHDLKSAGEIQLTDGRYQLIIVNERTIQKAIREIGNMQTDWDTPGNRVKKLAVQLLDAEKPLLIDDLSEQLHVSRSTLNNDLRRLRVTFDGYDLHILGMPNKGIQLSGSEWQKRLYILQNNEHLFDCPPDEEIKDWVHRFAVDNELAEATERSFSRYIGIALRRSATHPLETFNETFSLNDIIGTKEYQKVDTLAGRLKKRCGILPVMERAFLTIPILGRRSPVHPPDAAAASLPESIWQLIDEIGHRVAKQLHIEINFADIERELADHLMFMLNRLIFGVAIHNTLITEVREKYPLAYEMAEIASEVIDARYGIKVTDEELSYLAYYFGIAVIEQEEPLSRIKRIAIVCDTGRGSARIISMQLNKILPEQVEKQLFSSLSVSQEKMKPFDLIFSTVPLPNMPGPVIEVKDIFDEQKLAEKIRKCLALETLNIKSVHPSLSLTSQLFHEDRFFILSGQKSYIENLSVMMDRLEKKRLVDAAFRARILKKERVKATIFDQGIAFPHTINQGSQEIVLSVGICSPENKGDQGKARLIFLLGIPESQHNETLLVQLYDEMITLAKNGDSLYKNLDKMNCSEIRAHVKTLCSFNTR
ncbi:PRD domain-containing protein [Sporolactobacillus shoreicorticis]|uniref:BglG family transcription antiterminator n=1 Tax=Sporolactobacillus shoreicorticis TaxID=1923877 RepID=A0ABW5RZM4_9BACL|nr:PRD domain-containing protein [Sporolactobacillus shoreicorticis]MCO7127242.1 PRD domain-containing protein [Sporolactobacillus shoreicorticis]